MTPGADRLVDGLIRGWLKQTPLGRQIMSEAGMSLDQATEAVFELLNAGLLKITNPSPDHFSLAPSVPAQPPSAPVLRRPQ
jgi:hypothetical protein